MANRVTQDHFASEESRSVCTLFIKARAYHISAEQRLNVLRKISLFITKPGSTNQIELIKFLACDSEFNPSATLVSAASHQMAKNKVKA